MNTDRSGRRPVSLLLPLVGFGMFLAAASHAHRLPVSALAVVTAALVAVTVAVVVRVLRRERRVNAEWAARFEATQVPAAPEPSEASR